MFLHQLDPADPAFMPPEPTNTREFQAFDYATLESETRAIVQRCTSDLRSLTKRTTCDTAKTGEILIAVKTRLKHGQWLDWLVAEFDWSEQTARQFIHVAQWAKSTTFVDLSFDSTALYRLAAPRTPETARQEALARARQGETITCSKAQKIIDRHKYPPILPEVLPPEQAIVSAQEKVTVPSVTITIPAKPASSTKPSVGEGALLKAGVELSSQDRPDVKAEYHGQSEQEVACNAERGSNDYTQTVTGLQPEPPIKLISIDYDDFALQQNPLQLFEVTSADLHLHFESYLGDIVAWFQQQHHAFGQKAVQEAQVLTVNGCFNSSRS